jgi:hypothetical protein
MVGEWLDVVDRWVLLAAWVVVVEQHLAQGAVGCGAAHACAERTPPAGVAGVDRWWHGSSRGRLRLGDNSPQPVQTFRCQHVGVALDRGDSTVDALTAPAEIS